MCDASNAQPVTIEALLAALYALVVQVGTVGPFGLSGVLRLYVDAYKWGTDLTRPSTVRSIRRLGVQDKWGPTMSDETVALLVQAADLAEQGLSIVPVVEEVPWGKGEAREVDQAGRAAFFRRLTDASWHGLTGAELRRCSEGRRDRK